MTRYEAWLLLHVFAAVVWTGGGVVLAVVTLSAERFRRPVELALLAWVGPRVSRRELSEAREARRARP
jgi:uncharacterized membrane protein